MADSDRCQTQRLGQLRHCIMHLCGDAIHVADLRTAVSTGIRARMSMPVKRSEDIT